MNKTKRTGVSLMMSPEEKARFQSICDKYRWSMADAIMFLLEREGWLKESAGIQRGQQEVGPKNNLLRVTTPEELASEARVKQAAKERHSQSDAPPHSKEGLHQKG